MLIVIGTATVNLVRDDRTLQGFRKAAYIAATFTCFWVAVVWHQYAEENYFFHKNVTVILPQPQSAKRESALKYCKDTLHKEVGDDIRACMSLIPAESRKEYVTEERRNEVRRRSSLYKWTFVAGFGVFFGITFLIDLRARESGDSALPTPPSSSDLPASP